MRKSVIQRTGNIKLFLFIFALVIITGTLVYTQHLVNRLRHEASSLLNFYATVYAKAASDFSGSDYSFIFQEIIQRIEFPIAITQKTTGEPTAWKNIGLPANDFSADNLEKVKAVVRKMDRSTPPIPLKYEDILLGFIHYGDSDLILQLRLLPYIEIGLVALFILLGYFGFQIIRSNEKRNIWVGMAKETAHQLGTPLSSVMGWLELLDESPQKSPEIVTEIREDILRLKRVSERFSQIGSTPKCLQQDLYPIINEAIGYFRKRIPHLEKNVSLNVEMCHGISVSVNRELFSWALENLIKNALDAIHGENGSISVQCAESDSGNLVHIDISDTGRGILKKHWKDVFRPGFSSKQRGWGLGLSLTKRIIEDYHQGKIFILESHVNHGSTFRITIPRN